MKRIAAVTVFFILFMTPRVFAQAVVGEYSPTDGAYPPQTANGYTFCDFVSGCRAYQSFSLASGTHVSEIDIAAFDPG